MVTNAFVKLWEMTLGAIVWDERQQLAFFEYDKNFDLKKFPVAPIKMPRHQIYSFPELRTETFKGLPGLLADALPDRYGKDLIDIWLAQNGRPIDSLSPVELLCFMGQRSMGALEFEPTIAPKSKVQSIELASLIEYTQSLLSQKEDKSIQTHEAMRDTMIDVLKMGTSAGGARPKAIIAYNETNGEICSGQTLPGNGFEHWLIKFDSVNDTQFGATVGYGRVEMAYYAMARDAGINMMESRLVEENGRAHFMTKRFDRINGEEKVLVQTFCAIQHYDYQQPTSYSYEQLFQTMLQLRLSYAEAEEMFRRMTFNVIARNCDDHTKNFAFMMKQDGIWQLAPAYDVCHAYRPDSEWVSQHNLSINGKRSQIIKEDLLKIADQFNIRHAEKIIKEVSTVVNQWKTYADRYGVNELLRDSIDNTLLKEFDRDK
jgi:serine/threonine-protein kinase HipA